MIILVVILTKYVRIEALDDCFRKADKFVTFAAYEASENLSDSGLADLPETMVNQYIR